MIKPQAVDQIAALRTIESLRSGVPNRTAVRTLGMEHSAIAGALDDALGKLAGDAPETATGFLIEGGFGSGKSHVLTGLQQLALDQNFACSTVPVSKESTFATASSLFYNAIREMQLPGRIVGRSCAEVIDKINFDSRSYVDFLHAYTNEESPFDPIFGASLQVFERYQGLPDVIDSIIDFWDGEKCNIYELRANLKAVGLPYGHLKQAAENRLGLTRFDFVADLLRCAGFSGWVLLIDEVELIAKLSLLARAKSYANLASFLRCPGFSSPQRVLVIGAITDDLMYELFTNRADQEVIDQRLRLTRPELAEWAVVAIRFLRERCDRYRIPSPDAASLRRTYEKIRQIYEAAYPEITLPPEAVVKPAESSRSMRLYIKQWVTELDLRRLYAGYEPTLQVEAVTEDLRESEDQFLDESEDLAPRANLYEPGTKSFT